MKINDIIINGQKVSPVLPEDVKNYLIDIDGTICDNIPNEEDGTDYLDAKLNTEVRLEQKLATFDELWQTEGKSDEEIA